MKRLGYIRMVYVGLNESMGYIHDEEYALEIREATFPQKLWQGFGFWIFDMNHKGLPTPYQNVISFLMNWETPKR